MLINSIRAINFRKYQKLEISDIPETGVITVAGSNESGKTSIGEAICFALYGRTFFLDEKNLRKLVLWGKKLAEVTLTFTVGSGETYTLWRSIDNDGETRVKLQQDNSNLDNEDPEQIDATTIEDAEAVSEALQKILGFDFDAFSNSFYLAQRELTSPDPKSNAIKQMAGIGAFASISDDFELSNRQHEEVIQELTPKIASTQKELDDINLDETWLPDLVDAEHTLSSEKQDREKLVVQLEQQKEDYGSEFGIFHGARKMKGIWSLLSIILLPITLILGVLWVLVSFFNEQFKSILGNLFAEGSLESVTSLAENWLLPLFIISAVIYLLSLLLKKSAVNKMQMLREESAGFSRSLHVGHRYVTTLVETLMPERVVQMLHENDTEPTRLQVLPPREQFNNLTRLIDGAPEYEADPGEITAAVGRLTDALRKQDAEIEALGNQIGEDIKEEKIRSDAAGELRSALMNLNKIVDKSYHTIEVQNVSIDLLHRAAADLVTQFNQNIASISANTLPEFTENRYSKVQIAEDFTVQIYSDDKQDYMDFDEISSGTQRQVMLALRVAMSEELAKNTGNERQFIFLDEPFAFFDSHRTRATLKALPHVSDVITQVWISAQEFPADIVVEKSIDCPVKSAELIT